MVIIFSPQPEKVPWVRVAGRPAAVRQERASVINFTVQLWQPDVLESKNRAI
jgi:hypothetical protein